MAVKKSKQKTDKKAASRTRSNKSAPKKKQNTSARQTFPIVGIGASAGGLEAFSELLENLATDTGMAFVLIQHLAPEHHSMLSEILSRKSVMPVTEVKDGMQVEANHVYVIPPNTNMAVLHRKLCLMPRGEAEPHMPVDYFFRSLASDQGSKAIGVVLSGTASDGALGLKAIKGEGGITFAQDEETAKYYGMPRSAVAAGYVDFVLPPAAIAEEIGKISKHPYVSHVEIAKPEKILPTSGETLDKIIIILRNVTGVDFTYYKQSTLKRRILRRMVLHKIETIDGYLKYLQTSPEEAVKLFNDILINVTGFFRDPETFTALKERVFPKILKQATSRSTIRVWVPGCATGEEAYSLAITLLEFLGDRSPNTAIQIFATDISDAAIERARSGIYYENIAAEVSPERLHKFFRKVEGGYRISKSIRDLCIFARQDINRDPPFSNIDLISCRNVLIYLGQVLQKKVLPIFHYALKPHGFLFLGSSETVGVFSNLFALEDKKHKIYTKKSTVVRPNFDFVPMVQHYENSSETKPARRTDPAADLQTEVDRLLLAKYAPAGVVIDNDHQILHFRGHTGPYLEPAPGEASLDLMKMAREGLMLELRTLIHEVRKTKVPARKPGVSLRYNGRELQINVEVLPLKLPRTPESHYIVLFEDVTQAQQSDPPDRGSSTTAGKKSKDKSQPHKEEQLRKELETTKQYLQAIIEEQEATNEELRSANEEIQSSNEELQSTNEELETAKEELQSTNEELTTVNEELENRNQELSQANNDLSNLLDNINIPIIMLSNDLHIRRYTQAAERVLKVIPKDIGRKITDITPNVDLADLPQLVRDVIDTLTTYEREVKDKDGRWYLMCIRPYKTADNRIEGVVLSFSDIDSVKKSTARVARAYAKGIVDTIRVPLVVLDSRMKVVSANRPFCQTFKVTAEQTAGEYIYELGNRQWDIPALRKLLEEIIPKDRAFENYVVEHEFPGIGYRKLVLNGRQIQRDDVEQALILLAFEDVTHN